jgi:hypothetical protein
MLSSLTDASFVAHAVRGVLPTRVIDEPPGPAQGLWDCDGDLDANVLRTLVAQNRAQVRTCYEKRLKVDNVLQGSLNLKLRIGGNGKVSATQVGGSLRDTIVTSCVRTLAESWSFPTPSGGLCAVVEIPFNFTPKT